MADKTLIFDLRDEIPQVSQTFISLEGEGINVGEPSLYIRLAGCYSAACSFCDTKFSWFENSKFKPLYYEYDMGDQENKYSIGEWFDEIYNIQTQSKFKNRTIERITITGGEPLHFIRQIKNVAKLKNNFEDTRNINPKWLGIESNGNLLSNINVVLELIKTFKYLKNNGLKPHLTISPKIDSESCYNSLISDDEIDKMYQKVYSNLKNYFSFPVYFKFVWGVNENMNEKILNHLDYLHNLGFENKNLFLMPFTPDDYKGDEKDLWEKSKYQTARKALELGIRYSPRLHIDVDLD